MRVMRPSAIATFSVALTIVLVLALATAWLGGKYLYALGEFRSVVVSVTLVFYIYIYAIVVHRVLLWVAPLREGVIDEGSSQEFRYQVYVLFYLLLLNTLVRSRAIPIPLMRLVYLALGARLGTNTFSAGVINDPMFVTIGANSLVGESALLTPHAIEGNALAHFRISIGDNVTIGAHSVVLAGATIGNNAIVAANSVVTKGTEIKAGETWGGSPARLLSKGGPATRDQVSEQHRAN
jgi:acetyltransferase-like isoleucine patch superfamily enzyme